MERVRGYASLLVEWQDRMNLVGPATLPQMWSRHFRDSAQLVSLGKGLPGRIWLDVGSGAGFPALVIALLSDATVHLIEATAKKCQFLRTVIAECSIDNATVHNARIEALPAFKADVISARACAPLAQLFAWGRPFANASTQWLLPKGASYRDEVDAARRDFDFESILHPSLTEPMARIVEARLHIGEGRRR